jgi:CHAD domain-containing protein
MAAPRRQATIPSARWREHLVAQLPGARAGEPERVHQLRVAIARLRVWLTLGGYRVLHDDLKWLRDQAAVARDLDVHLALRPSAALAQRLVARQEDARHALRVALATPRAAALLEALSLLPAVGRADAERRLARLARAALRRGARAYEHPHDLVALHRLRRAVRRLRFGLEWLDRAPRPLLRLQTELGAIGDRALALRDLDAVPRGARSFGEYRHRLERELQRHARHARQLWPQTVPTIEEIAAWKSS